MICLRCIAVEARHEHTAKRRLCAKCELAALPPFDTDAMLDRVDDADRVTADQERAGKRPARNPGWWRALPGSAMVALGISVVAVLLLPSFDPRVASFWRFLALLAIPIGALTALGLLLHRPVPFPGSRNTPTSGLRAYLRAMVAGKYGLAWDYVLPAAQRGNVHRRAFPDVDVPGADIRVNSPEALRLFWQPLLRKTGCGRQCVSFEGFAATPLDQGLTTAICRLRIQHAHFPGGQLGVIIFRYLLALLTSGYVLNSPEYPTVYVWITVVMRKVDRLWYAAHIDFFEVEPELPDEPE